ncbi:MAG TPA: zinc-ribbon domain-containing protein [Methanoregula sp.]|nr:zinc-ribbon domain-containing protein [Methanoregula sp.]
MFCGECGTENPDTNQFCKNCGNALRKAPVTEHSGAPAVPVPVPQAPVLPVSNPGTGISTTGKIAIVLGALCGVTAFFILPYLLGMIAVLLGAFVLYKKNKIGVICILLGISAIIFDYFYLQIIP